MKLDYRFVFFFILSYEQFLNGTKRIPALVVSTDTHIINRHTLRMRSLGTIRNKDMHNDGIYV